MECKNSDFLKYSNELSSTRKLVINLIDRLEKELKESEEEISPAWRKVWGEKENIVSSLTKLVSLLIKIIPMEQDIQAKEQGLSGDSVGIKGINQLTENCPQEDKKIIDEYIKRVMEKKIKQ
ncbi:hypothetical protein N9W34_02870 [Rickettsiales bacterium]|nr:hypothetical protein [Rickettsiales bacterium]